MGSNIWLFTWLQNNFTVYIDLSTDTDMVLIYFLVIAVPFLIELSQTSVTANLE